VGLSGGEVYIGALPNPGDEVLIARTAAPGVSGSRWMLVTGVEPCDDRAWAYLTGTWCDGPRQEPDRLLVWVDHLAVRRAPSPSPESR
jgi:hypothetical protein